MEALGYSLLTLRVTIKGPIKATAIRLSIRVLWYRGLRNYV